MQYNYSTPEPGSGSSVYQDDPASKILPRLTDHHRIMTYNVHGFKDIKNKNKLNQIIGIIASINPDILVLEEVFVFKRNETIHQDDLTKLLKQYDFRHFAFSATGINMVCAKHEMNARELDLGRDRIKGIARNALICTFPKIPDLTVIGTHLDVFDNTGKTRKKQITNIIQYLYPDNAMNSTMRYIILGDFNSLRKADYSDPEWNHLIKMDALRKVKTVEDAVPMLQDIGFVDSFVACGLNLKVSVWSGRRVDYILGKNITWAQSAVHKITASDHYPVYADFRA
jgi:endonuclease/exonuclease/phosphatase family metal-dependent hydrolase